MLFAKKESREKEICLHCKNVYGEFDVMNQSKWSRKSRILCMFCLAAVFGWLQACGGLPMEPPKKYEVALTAKMQPTYQANKPIIVEYTFTNTTKKTLYVLDWHSPLEGIKNKIFKAERDGQTLEYQGPMVKRGNPVKDNYKEIKPGQSITAKVDLAKAYDITKAGKYRFEYNGKLMDHSYDGKAIPKVSDKLTPYQTAGSAIHFTIK